MSFIEHIIGAAGGDNDEADEPFSFEGLRTNLTFAHMVTLGRRHWTYEDIAACVRVADEYLEAHQVEFDTHLVVLDLLEFHSQRVQRTPQYLLPNLCLFFLELHRLHVGIEHLRFMFTTLRNWWMDCGRGDLFEHTQGQGVVTLLKVWDWQQWPAEEQMEDPEEVAHLAVVLEQRLRAQMAVLLGVPDAAAPA
jgi:hypothetical protein